jgi:hypothetical protein
MPKNPHYNQETIELLKIYIAKLDKKETIDMLYMSSKWNVVSKNFEGLIDKLSKIPLEEISEDKLFKLGLYKEFL